MFLQKKPNRFFSAKEIMRGANCTHMPRAHLLLSKLIKSGEVIFDFEGRKKMYKVTTKEENEFKEFAEQVRNESAQSQFRLDDYLRIKILYELWRKNGSKRIQK